MFKKKWIIIFILQLTHFVYEYSIVIFVYYTIFVCCSPITYYLGWRCLLFAFYLLPPRGPIRTIGACYDPPPPPQYSKNHKGGI